MSGWNTVERIVILEDGAIIQRNICPVSQRRVISFSTKTTPGGVGKTLHSIHPAPHQGRRRKPPTSGINRKTLVWNENRLRTPGRAEFRAGTSGHAWPEEEAGAKPE